MKPELTKRWYLHAVIAAVFVTALPGSTRANEIWVAPTSQQDFGGLGVASNAVWPVTPAGAVRLAWGIPDDMQAFESAKVVLIPAAPGGAATLNLYVCPAQNGNVVTASCGGPFTQAFTGVPNQLAEVEIGALISSRVGTAGVNNLAVLAFTTPTTATDHIVGLRFTYSPKVPAGVATLGANTFTGTQTAPAFVGDGTSLANVAKLRANTFTGNQTAPMFIGDGSLLTNLPFPAGAATLGVNTFTGTQTAPNVNVGQLGVNTTSPFGTLSIGSLFDPAFRIEPSDGTPYAGYIRFGDTTGWQLVFAPSRNCSGCPLAPGFANGVGPFTMLMNDQGFVSVAGELEANDVRANFGVHTFNTELDFFVQDSSLTSSHFVSYIDNGGVYHVTSSRAAKEGFRDLNLDEILAKIERLPVMEWNYKNQDSSIRHVGPFAEDFHEIFGLDGGNAQMISMVDPSGVALAGVKALAARAHERDALIEGQRQQIEAQQEQLTGQQQRIEALERRLQALVQRAPVGDR